MRKHLIIGATIMASLLAASSALAGGPCRGGPRYYGGGYRTPYRCGPSGYGYGSPYHARYGYRFNHGHYYRGCQHRHWSYCGYSAAYKCYLYWCPSSHRYYYWHRAHDCFYPVNYYRHAPPSVVQAPINVQKVNLNVNVNNRNVNQVNQGVPVPVAPPRPVPPPPKNAPAPVPPKNVPAPVPPPTGTPPNAPAPVPPPIPMPPGR